jgi:cell division protein FtsL
MKKSQDTEKNKKDQTKNIQSESNDKSKKSDESKKPLSKREKWFIAGIIFLFAVSLVFFLGTVYYVLRAVEHRARIDNLEESLEAKEKLIEFYPYDCANGDDESVSEDFQDGSENDSDDDEYEVESDDNNSQEQLHEAVKFNMEVPEGWNYTTSYSSSADLDEDPQTVVVSEFRVINSQGDEATFNFVPVFGITLSFPIRFQDSANDLSAYASHDPLQDSLRMLQDITYGELNCGIDQSQQAVYCDAYGEEYIDCHGLRLLLLEGGMIALQKDQAKDTWVVNDGVDWGFDQGYFTTSFQGGWSIAELEKLCEALDTVEFE